MNKLTFKVWKLKSINDNAIELEIQTPLAVGNVMKEPIFCRRFNYL